MKTHQTSLPLARLFGLALSFGCSDPFSLDTSEVALGTGQEAEEEGR